jgi:hypothetical protein
MLWGTCDYPAEIAKFQAARTAGTKLISVTTVGAFKAFDYINDVDAALSDVLSRTVLCGWARGRARGKVSLGANQQLPRT